MAPHIRPQGNLRNGATGAADLAVVRRGTTLEVAVRGELRNHSIPEFVRAVARALDDCDERVVLDLHDLAFVDSAGIAALLDAGSHAAARHRDLVLVDVQEDVRAALSRAGADEALVVASE